MPPSLFARWARMLEGASEMGDLFVHRFQFAFTVVYHYLFPQLTMGLALLIVLMKARGLRPDGKRWNDAARFWIRIFGINFAVGVGTGISMEFQFGTNWARFSRYAGSVIGQTLVPVHARLSSSPPEKSQHGDGESDSTIVTLGVARARQVRVAPSASSRGPFDLRGV